jgi:SSS family solute:Na+ symporter
VSAGVAFHALDWAALAVYFGGIVAVGMFVSKFTKTTADFFLGGQRFPWWLVSMSCVATLVGSYSFINYSEVGFNFGFASVTNYTNEWFVIPLFLIGWLPVIYFNRILSIPEYFERRFDLRTRRLVLVLLLIYLEGYIGINLLTIGVAMKGLFGWNVMLSATGIAILSALYLHAGGQTSVLITDLLQGFLLLAAGLTVLVLGFSKLGGFGAFLDGLPMPHKLPFARFNSPPEFHFVGEFWGDAITGTFAFYLINQGVLMRFLSAKSVADGRKAMLFTAAFLMPLAAVAVGGAGWVGRAMVTQGLLPADTSARDVFVTVARAVCTPGIFGFVVAAMIAALMSTLDTLISAVSAIAVNDVWKPLYPNRDDKYYLGAARHAALGATVLGIFLIPVFEQFKSIYQALSYFTSSITPPLVVVIVLGLVWRRFTARAAFWSLLLGSIAMVVSIFQPAVVTPFSHGVDPSEGFTYLRSCYGVFATLAFAFVCTWLDPDKSEHAGEGLTLSSIRLAMEGFKGGKLDDAGVGESSLSPWKRVDEPGEIVRVPAELAGRLSIREGDLIYLADPRWWLGGFRSIRAKAAGPAGGADIEISNELAEHGGLKSGRPVRLEKIL